jgi:hypothetical protein
VGTGTGSYVSGTGTGTFNVSDPDQQKDPLSMLTSCAPCTDTDMMKMNGI